MTLWLAHDPPPPPPAAVGEVGKPVVMDEEEEVVDVEKRAPLLPNPTPAGAAAAVEG